MEEIKPGWEIILIKGEQDIHRRKKHHYSEDACSYSAHVEAYEGNYCS